MDVIHAESEQTDVDEIWDRETGVHRMVCGAECLIFDDGAVIPDIDFFNWANRHKATCPACKKMLMLTPVRETEEVC